MPKQDTHLTQPMTELRITLSQESKLELHTFDPSNKTFMYFHFGFVPNPGRVLSQAEVQHVQETLTKLGVNEVKIDTSGFTLFDRPHTDSDRIGVRDVLCFGDIFGVYGLIIFYDETLQKWLTEPVSVPKVMEMHQKMNQVLNQQFNPMKSSFI